jgi:hypothetical protein
LTFEIALQLLVAVLLGVTIVYAVILNRRLARLRDGREEMGRLMGELSAAMVNAENGLATLRRTAFEDDEALGRRIAEARTARDEIGFLVDRAESLSGRLEAQIGNSRGVAAATRQSVPMPVQDPATEEADAFLAGGRTGDDVAAAQAARATATAWLRNRDRTGPDAQPVAASRGLR